ncbi:MAG TPA: (Fe-S)-binding protein, partial [Phycisphaerae bacterium]|nr:(Fe-S)-binding protein [Phycisphaerae bacterium]
TYVDKIVDMRRNLVMEKSEFPAELQNAFRGMETNSNPWSFPASDRAGWAAGLDVPRMAEKPDAQVLFWVGCSASFDDRARKIARATAQLLKAAGVDFAILAEEEQCTGDPARRAGNEFLFQMLAQANVETLNRYQPRTIVTTCPHCFNTLLNEYPDFGGKFNVVHHSQFLSGLVQDGKLQPKNRVDGRVAFHDSCYLGRYNEVYEAPRQTLRAIPGLTVLEPRETRDRGMCCGAGGAQMFKEEEHARPGAVDERVNLRRTDQLLATEPTMVASACPFCQRMLIDGLAGRQRSEVQQFDIAELLLRSIDAPQTQSSGS